MKLNEYFEEYAFNSLQKQQLRDADKKGLDLEIIADPRYDWEQMQELIIGMEQGLDITVYADFLIHSDQMKEIRERLYEESGKYDEHKNVQRQKKMKLYSISAILIVLLFTGIFIAYSNKDKLMLYVENISLELSTDKVVIGTGEVFNAIDYIESYDQRYEVTLPDNIDTSKPATYQLIYSITNTKKVTTKTLIVEVIDKTAPVITLSTVQIDINAADELNPKEYVVEVTDNITSNLLDSLTYRVENIGENHNRVIYTVFDDAGNEATATLDVFIKTTVIQIPSTNTSSNDNSNNINQSSNENSITVGSNNESITKYFYFSDGYDGTSAYNSCVSEGQQYSNYRCSPITDSNGIYIGYQLET